MSRSVAASVSGSQSFAISFSYDWNFNELPPPDLFTAELLINDGMSDEEVVDVFSSESSSSSFDPQLFSTNISVVSLAIAADAIQTVGLRFSLFEGRRGTGTVLNLDDVALTVVPIPAAAWLFGSALLGFMALSNRRAA
jgi:hypothetical protein